MKKTRFRTLSARGNPLGHMEKRGSGHFLPKGILMPREVPPEEGAGKGEQHLSNELSHQNGLLYALKK